MDVTNYIKKFQTFLEYVFDGKIVLNKYNTEKLLSFFEDCSDNSPGKILLDTPYFSDLIMNWLNKTVTTSPKSIKLLFIEIVTKLFENELQFTKLHMQGLRSSLKNCILGNIISKTNPDLQLASVKLATVQITHCSGVRFILEHKLWEHILTPDNHLKPKKNAIAAYNFVSQLIRKLNQYEREQELIEILGYIVKPIIESGYLSLEEINDETDKALAEKIWTNLNALLIILSDMENENYNHVYTILRSNFGLEHILYNIQEITRYSELIILLNDINIRLFYTVIGRKIFMNKTDEVCNEVVAFYHNTILHCINKRDVRAVIDFSIKCYIFWSNLEKNYKDTNAFSVPLTFSRNGQKYELCSQVVVNAVIPLIIYGCSNHHTKMFLHNDDLVEAMNIKIAKSLTEHILSTCYSFRTFLEDGDLKKISIDTVRELFRLKRYLNESQAGMIFQVLYHVLSQFIMSDGVGTLIVEESPIECPDDKKLLSLVLDAIRMVMKEHNISWYENVEIIRLKEGLMNLLKQRTLDTRHTVQVLDLIDICVVKFLSPNMTLLVDIHKDSTLTEIGAVMNRYLQHDAWEVRDSAANLLLSCTDIAFIKYVPLQKVIRENNLMILAAKLALSDPEYYAQSTGLKCVASATKLDCIWREVVIDNPHIYLQIIYILRHNPEGIVRKEAAKVLTAIYKHQKLIPSFQNILNEVMMITALDDLHWEVQLEALEYWKHTIKNQLSFRGMIDGTFPSVTFSKEKRKIIKLDEREIINQLTAIMNDLSEVGCLTVLLECMNEGYNIEIMEKAHGIAKELIEILDKHKFGEIIDISDVITCKEEMSIKGEDTNNEDIMDWRYFNYNESSSSSDLIKDQVIDSILETDLSELIMDLHDNQIKSGYGDDEYKVNVTKEKINPNIFLEKFRNTDYLSIINVKRSWNADVYSSLDALLDDLLDV